MAFNPFANFRKYQKFWIAGLILLCMVSFIVCSGVGFEQMFTNLIQQMRGGATVYVQIDGTDYHFQELDLVRKQRKWANGFMRAATEMAIHKLNDRIKKENQAALEAQRKKDEKRMAQANTTITLSKMARAVLQQRLREKSYFGGSATKIDDLVDFLVWRKQADRLSINLDRKLLLDEIDRLMMTPITGYDVQDAQAAMARVRDQFGGPDVTDQAVEEALRQELRVSIAKMALAGVRLSAIFAGELAESPLMKQILPSEKERYFYAEVLRTAAPYEWRLTLIPEEIRRHYKERLTRFDVALVPFSVDAFTNQVAEPREQELEAYFEKYKTRLADPSADTPGFVQPESGRFAYLTVNPRSAKMKHLVRTFTSFAGPGLVLFLQNNYESDKREAAEADKQHRVQVEKGPFGIESFSFRTVYDEETGLLAWWTSARPRTFEAMAEAMPNSFRFLAASLLDPNYDLDMYYKRWSPVRFDTVKDRLEMKDGTIFNSEQVGELVAARFFGLASSPTHLGLAPAYLQAAAKEQQEDELRTVVATESDRRARAIATVFGGTVGNPLGGGALWDAASRKIDYLPFEAVADRYRDRFELRLAEETAGEVMELARGYLQGKRAKGNRREFTNRVQELLRDYPILELYETKQFVNEHTVASDPDLAEFYRIFQEQANAGGSRKESVLYYINLFSGRLKTEKELTEDSFPQLFFASGDPYSVASQESFVAMQWPPEVITPNTRPLTEDPERFKVAGIDLTQHGMKFDTWKLPWVRRYVLFWRIEHKGVYTPKSLAEVRDKVELAWRREQARRIALAEAKKAALEIRSEQKRTGEINVALLETWAQKLGTEPLYLREITEWYPFPTPLGIDYPEWGQRELQRMAGKQLPYPRDDMAKNIVALRKLKEPISTGTKPKDPGFDKAVNEANKELFDKELPRGLKQVQILPNSPRHIYWVTVVIAETAPSHREFVSMYNASTSGDIEKRDNFIFILRERLSKEHIRALTDQLREAARATILTTEGFE